MKCGDFVDALMARSEGLPPRGEPVDMAGHRRICPSCARLQDEFERLEARLEQLSEDVIEAPPFLKSRILARIREENRRRAFHPFRFLTSRRALAASTTCLAFFAGLLAREVYRLNEWVRANPIQTVVLEHEAPDAREVALLGDFNGWGRELGLVRAENVNGRWVFRLELAPGRYQYAFVEDGNKWLPDLKTLSKIPDGFGGMNSVLYVPAKGDRRRGSL